MRRDDFCAVGDQDAMNVLDEVLRRRNELKITGRLSMSNDGSDSETTLFDHSESRQSLELEADQRP